MKKKIIIVALIAMIAINANQDVKKKSLKKRMYLKHQKNIP